MTKKHTMWQGLLLCLGLCLGQPAAAGDSQIVMVDIPYELLDALGEYAELRIQEEQQGREVDAEMLPVLDTIITEYTGQQARLREMLEQVAGSQALQLRLDKISLFIQAFRDEHDYRQALVKYRELTRKQRQLIEEK